MENDLKHSIDRCADLAVQHRCTYACGNVTAETLYATGTPPAGYWQKLAACAARHNYTLQHSHLPSRLYGPGCTGLTSGDITPAEQALTGATSRTVSIEPGMTPATEFFVTCHELTHALLNHPYNQLDGQVRENSTGARENYTQEVQAHLAAIAVAREAGLSIRRSALCYLSDKVHSFMRAAGAEEKYGALLAARQIAAAF